MNEDTKLILDQLAALRAAKAEPDYKMSRANLLTEAFKGLLVINGGGVVALLAFLQAIWDKNAPLRQIVLVGIAWMLAGLVVALFSMFLRFHHSKFGEKHDKQIEQSQFLRLILKVSYTGLLYGSALCFAYGAGYLVIHALRL
jgi:pilus assembly protein TadC